ncbi:MAG: glycosyltransferase family 39 protein [Endomicrobia bacterium]|nr:glycosyltransferase family 39 protein [Endomicrobiia bacterium]
MKNKTLKLILIFLLSFTTRIAYLLLSDYPDKALRLYDAPSWDAVGWNFLQRGSFLEANGLPTAIRPPIYPLFLSKVYFLFGRNYMIVFLLQSLISSFTNTIIFIWFCSFFDLGTSFLAAVFCSIWPPFIVYSGIICSETLFMFLFIIFLVTFYKAYMKNNLGLYFISGALLGLTNLTRSTLILYPLFLLFFMYLFRYKIEIILKTLLIFLISILVILPWTIRNYRVFDRFLLVNVSAGELFWSGTYLPWDGICKHNRDEEFFRMFNLENPVDNERKMFREGIKNIFNNPLGFIKLSIKKFFRFWFKPVGEEVLRKRSKIFTYLLYSVQIFFVIFFWYFLLINLKNKLHLPIIVLVLYFTIMHNLLSPIPRYRLPLELIIISFSITGIKKIFYRIFNEKNFIVKSPW